MGKDGVVSEGWLDGAACTARRGKGAPVAGFTLARKWAGSYLDSDVAELLKASLAWCITELRVL